jgi:hypothetical protein
LSVEGCDASSELLDKGFEFLIRNGPIYPAVAFSEGRIEVIAAKDNLERDLDPS